ncbi:DNA-binding protein HU-beta [Enhygromyxa salina]|uniref:DNA-binding protein HU-beta n=1 Tax=Enhygromyxa salina TaxID=215803 RepID=A0A2S9XCN1_9BACT|nr:HU family DNA-binding protein [Enhygromyxa salina]PRP90560.1 DNA-binding protein HU-beta [Enhygromyxa salina]
MTKAELIDRIARNRDLPPDVTKKVIAKILDLAFTELAAYFVRSRVTRSSNPRFTYPKFGTFTKKKRSGRRGVNPRTLEPMDIEACETVDFKLSTDLKRQLNEVSAPSKTKATRKKKKAARTSGKTKRKTASKTASKTAAKQKKRKPASKLGAPAAGPRGRKLVTREEVELEPPIGESLLPDAPLRKVTRRRRNDDLDGTGS